MSTTKVAVAGLVLMIAVGLALVLPWRRDDIERERSIRELADEVAALRAELRRRPTGLREQDGLATQVVGARSEPQRLGTTHTPDASTSDVMAEGEPPVNDKPQWPDQLRERTTNDDARQAELDAEIQGQPVNRSWEAEIAEHLDRALSVSHLIDSRVVSLHCGSSVCRAEVAHGDSDEQDELPVALMNALPVGYDQWGRNVDDPEGRRSLVYFARHEVRITPAAINSR